MSQYNILFLSAGRRVELLKHFKNASRKLNLNSKIVAVDNSKTAPALYFADTNYIVPKVSDDNYLKSILDICKREHISMIIPTIDTELLFLAKNKVIIEEKTHAKVMVSDFDVIDICRDKVKSQSFFEKYNFGVPKIFSREEINQKWTKFPLFIKPKSGSSSENVFKIDNIDEFNVYSQIVPDPMIQEFVEGDEYTVDVFNDFDGNVVSIVPRLRMATRSGEISKGKIVKNQKIIKDIKRLMSLLKPKGHVTVQLIDSTKGFKYIEINPRFGGGAPMSIESGANSCENIYKILMGKKLEYNENYKDDLVFLRYDSSICLNDYLGTPND